MTVFGGDIILASDLNEVYNASVDRPLCVVTKSTVTSIDNNGENLVWDTETVDTHAWHSTSVNTGRITPLKAGWVEFRAVVFFASNATGRRGVAIRENGGTLYYGQIIPGSSAGTIGVMVAREFEVDGSTDYYEVFAYQDSGGALNSADTANTHFSAKWVRGS